jgi:hypothetical protein
MIRGQPPIQYLYGLNFIVGQFDEARRFLAPISGITIYLYLQKRQPPISPIFKRGAEGIYQWKIDSMPLIE